MFRPARRAVRSWRELRKELTVGQAILDGGYMICGLTNCSSQPPLGDVQLSLA